MLRSWKQSASESIFSVEPRPFVPLQSLDESRSSRKRLRRNRKPCGRCSDMQKKCDIFHPYSQERCGGCTRANLSSCPPYKPRRRGGGGMKTQLSHCTEEQLLSGSGPLPIQRQNASAADAAAECQQSEMKPSQVETQFSLQSQHLVASGLGSTDNLVASRSELPAIYFSLNNFEQEVLHGLGPDRTQSNNSFPFQPSRSEDIVYDGEFFLSAVYVPAFLPSL